MLLKSLKTIGEFFYMSTIFVVILFVLAVILCIYFGFKLPAYFVNKAKKNYKKEIQKKDPEYRHTEITKTKIYSLEEYRKKKGKK